MAGENLSAVADEEFFARQRTLDVEKWLKSERAGRDLCGSMAYCVFCVKAETHPCAKAEFRYKMRAALREIEADAAAADAAPEQTAPDENTQNALREECAEEIIDEVLADKSAGKEVAPERAAEEIMQDGGDKGKSALPEGYEEVIRLRRSFKSKLIQNAQAQDRYTELKNALAGISGIKSRLCQGCENFRIGRKKIAKMNIGGKTLVLYLALDPAEYEDTKYRFSDVSEKKTYAETPMKLRITSDRALRHAKELIEALAVKLDAANVGYVYMDYHFPYKTDEQLIAKGLIKPYKAIVKKREK